MGPYWFVVEMTDLGPTVKRNSLRTSAEAQIAVASITIETNCVRRDFAIMFSLMVGCDHESTLSFH
jgi:hypothetical protein